MNLNILVQDTRLRSGNQCCVVAKMNYDEDIPWTIIHEAEHFLRLKIIVCEDCGIEHFVKEEIEGYEDIVRIPYEEVMSSFKTTNCSTQSDFLDVLRLGIVEYFGDTLTPDEVDAVLLRKRS